MKIGYPRASRRPGDVAATWYRESGIECDAGAFGTPHCCRRARRAESSNEGSYGRRCNSRGRPAMEQQLERCCGLDVHKATIAARVRLGGRPGRAEEHGQTVGTTVGGLLGLGDWLAAHGGTDGGVGRPGRSLEARL